ncbi:MAG: hypothetical protein ABI625_26480, partial [bacterium]
PGPADRKTLDAILERASIDSEFRRLLIADWRRAIHQSFGIVVPQKFRMRFVERDADVDALIVLPDLKHREGELSDGDLENVAGGVNDDGSEGGWGSAVNDALDDW